MAVSTSERAIRFILREIIGEVLYFPLWWYSIGFVAMVRSLWGSWLTMTERLAIRILARNMLRPMYADYSRTGRIISFFFRILILGVRLIVLLIWTAIELAMIVLWITVPLFAAALLVRQLYPL